MKIETVEECAKYFEQYRELNKGVKHLVYSIPAKRDAITVLENTWKSGDGITIKKFAEIIGVSQITIRTWRNQYNLGLYNNTDGATHVSKVVQKSHCSALATLEAEKKRIEEESTLQLAQLAAQIAAIKTLESNGFSISKA